jgi:predicted acetyltransferase
MTELVVRIVARIEITPEMESRINELDHLAFSAVMDDELKDIQWSESDEMALGNIDDILVSQLGLVYRQIRVGETDLQVAGVGGVATHPLYQHRGYSSQLLVKTREILFNAQRVPFGLLICEEKLEPFYAACGWEKVADSLDYWQENQRHTLKTPVMILSLDGQKWPAGVIDVCGSPW